MDMDAKIVLWWIAEIMMTAALMIGIVLMSVTLIIGVRTLGLADMMSMLVIIGVMIWAIEFVHDVCEFKLNDLEAELGTH